MVVKLFLLFFMDHNSDKLLYLFKENESIMGRFYLFMLILLPAFALYGKEIPQDIQGFVNDNGEKLFYFDGYTIILNEMEGRLEDEATVRLIERTYQMDHIRKRYMDSKLSVANKMMESTLSYKNWPFPINQKCMLLQMKPDRITVLYLETFIAGNSGIEGKILKGFFDGKLNKATTTLGSTALYIKLVGKNIYLPANAEWVAPGKVMDEDSQISWSEFSSASRAEQYLANQKVIDKLDNVEVVSEDKIEVLFDGKSVMSHRIVYRDLSDEPGGDYLIAYYVEGVVRRRNVAGILSHYSNKESGFSLSPLLESVMQVVSSVRGNEDYSSVGEKTVEARYQYGAGNNYFNDYRFEFQFGTMLPFGNLRDAFPMAPSLGVYASIPVFFQVGLDMGFTGAIPIKSSFDYYYSDGSTEHTRSTGILGASFRVRYLLHQTGGWLFSGYVGAGANCLFTNIPDEDSYDWETDTYNNNLSIVALDVFVGCNISYKKVGFFVEYHLTPYGSSNKVKYDFGKHLFNVGLTFTTGLDL